MCTYASSSPSSPKALSLRGPLRDENAHLYTLAQVVSHSAGDSQGVCLLHTMSAL